MNLGNRVSINRLEIDLYSSLPPPIILSIAQERDVDIGNESISNKCQRLTELDTILPDWKNEILTVSPNNLSRLTRNQLYIYAHLHGVSVRKLYQEGLIKNTIVQILYTLSQCPEIHQHLPPPKPIIQQPQLRVKRIELRSFSELTRSTANGFLPAETVPVSLFPLADPRNVSKLVMELIQYPLACDNDYYLRLRSMPMEVLIYVLIQRNIDEILSRFMNREELIFAISRRYLPPLSDALVSRRARYQMLQRLRADQLHNLYNLYDIDAQSDAIIELSKIIEPSPIEYYIIHWNELEPAAVAEVLGMIVPLGVNKNDYIWRNLQSYTSVLLRQANINPPSWSDLDAWKRNRRIHGEGSIEEHLNYVPYMIQYKDTELLTGFGLYINYTSRADLIIQLAKLVCRAAFYIPLQRSLVTNAETMLYSSTSDPSVFLIGYGTIQSCHGYEIDELIASFQYRDDDGISDFVFLHPENIRCMFNIPEIEQLQSLLRAYHNPLLQPLLDKVGTGLVEVKKKTNFDRSFLRTMKGFSSTEHSIIQQWLQLLFDTGMYMRRWGGPGTPYPMATKQTERKVLPDQKVSSCLIELSDLINTLSNRAQHFVKNLLMIEYYEGNPDQTTKKLGDQIAEVMSGELCIRMASTRFRWTSHYYLVLFFNHIIPDFSPPKLTRVY